MVHRSDFLLLLSNYAPSSAHEDLLVKQTVNFVKNNEDCFSRANLSGHITGSCWLVDPSAKRVLLTHHKKIGRWLQLGGHADGNGNLLAVAIKEAQEESGIDHILALQESIFDIDIHQIEPHQNVPAHLHFDVRFLLQAGHSNYTVSPESNMLAWFPIETLTDNDVNDSIKRMAHKYMNSHSQPDTAHDNFRF